MAQPDVAAFVMQRLAQHWGHCPVVGMNTVGEAPQNGGEYLLVQYPASSNGMADVAEQQQFELGGVRFILHMLRGEGLERATQWGLELGNLFKSVRSGGLKFGTPSSPYYDDTNDEGAYFLVSVVVPYRFDF